MGFKFLNFLGRIAVELGEARFEFRLLAKSLLQKRFHARIQRDRAVEQRVAAAANTRRR